MTKLILAAAAALFATSALAQHVPSGQSAGGPDQLGISGELQPGAAPLRRKGRGVVPVRTGQTAGGLAAYGRPGQLRPGKILRVRAAGRRTIHVRSGQTAGGPLPGVPGQVGLGR